MEFFYKLLKTGEKISGFFLNLFAVLNIYFLFLNYFDFGINIVEAYTKLSILMLLLFQIYHHSRNRINLIKIRNVLPDLLFMGIGFFVADSSRVFQFYLLGRQSYFLVKNFSIGDHRGGFLENFSTNPAVLVLISFFLAIFTGTLLLMLPIATVVGKTTSLVGALFTSTSATCVTGLIVYDTGTHFSQFGQLIILVLIQIGGLGIMTISSAFAIMLGQRLSLRSENMMQSVVGESNRLDMTSLIKNIILVTFSFELIGTTILYLSFNNTFGSTSEALYYSVFHSISAFCNAGFSLFADSFMPYKFNININLVITSLIIIGGIGFPVLVDIRKNLFNGFRFSRLTLHSKIVISATIFLIIVGLVGFFIGEYNYQMKGFSLPQRLLTSFFQSITTRTAGFNTIDNGLMSKPSVLLTIMLMFIGASPGSTGGGIKTTTLMIVIVSVLAMFKGNRDVSVYKRKISLGIIQRVMALIASSLIFVTVMIFFLLLIEPFAFEKTIFEAVSAFGTVGLSMGITADLSVLGQIIIIILMYLGRVGPLTLIFAISETKPKTNYSYTEERVLIG